MQLLNNDSIDVTLAAVKLARFKDVIRMQLANVPLIDSSRVVEKCDRLIDVKLPHDPNMWSIVVTSDVSKLLMFKDASAEQ